MKKYEAMFIVKPDLKEEERNSVMKAVKDQIIKHQGVVSQDQIWAERRKLAYDLFPIGGGVRYKEALYYLVNFDADPASITAIKSVYGLNEQILRYLIVRVEDTKPV
ncbi:MAG: 30S ribosomal protein S6 [Candidatus Omnitrophota bacterium]